MMTRSRPGFRHRDARVDKNLTPRRQDAKALGNTIFGSGPAAAHARQRKGQDCTVRTFVPEGLSESSPVRSAGLAFLKNYPSRTGRSVNAGNR